MVDQPRNVSAGVFADGEDVADAPHGDVSGGFDGPPELGRQHGEAGRDRCARVFPFHPAEQIFKPNHANIVALHQRWSDVFDVGHAPHVFSSFDSTAAWLSQLPAAECVATNPCLELAPSCKHSTRPANTVVVCQVSVETGVVVSVVASVLVVVDVGMVIVPVPVVVQWSL